MLANWRLEMNDYREFAQLYAKIEYSGTGYLAYRDLPQLIDRYLGDNIKNSHALDYGCGTGDSTRVLSTIGFKNVTGVDIDERMINIAKTKNTSASFELINSAVIDKHDNYYDLALSCLVLMEVSTKSELIRIFNEIHRVLKPQGVFIFIVASEHIYQHDWLTVNTNFAQNKHAKSGDIVKINLTDIDLTIYDYFWNNQDYMEVIQQTGFRHVEKLAPRGNNDDGYDWRAEKRYPPFTIYVIQK